MAFWFLDKNTSIPNVAESDLYAQIRIQESPRVFVDNICYETRLLTTRQKCNRDVNLAKLR